MKRILIVISLILFASTGSFASDFNIHTAYEASSKYRSSAARLTVELADSLKRLDMNTIAWSEMNTMSDFYDRYCGCVNNINTALFIGSIDMGCDDVCRAITKTKILFVLQHNLNLMEKSKEFYDSPLFGKTPSGLLYLRKIQNSIQEGRVLYYSFYKSIVDGVKNKGKNK